MEESNNDSRRSRFFDYRDLCVDDYETKKSRKDKCEYINLSCSFDIEATSFYEEGSKRGTMYAFVFGVDGRTCFGRTWNDFLDCCKTLQEHYGLGNERRLPVYIHNESYEFQWFCKWLNWIELFAVDERKPIRALTDYGIEFRDSYILSGASLDTTAKDLTKYKVEKMAGDLDYSLLRHSETKLTPKEWHYLENDGLVVMAFIQEEIERNNDNITHIPMTKTGYVRKYIRSCCYHDGQKGHGKRRKLKTRSFQAYSRLMSILTLTKEEYLLAKEAFQGGFTHANAFNVGLTMENVRSFDLTSAYPSVMVLEARFPMGRGMRIEKPSKSDIRKYLEKYACIFPVKMWGVRSRFRGDNFLSFSKCRRIKNYNLDNGRVESADYLETTITEIDFDILRAFYSIERVEIPFIWVYPRGYLPKNFIKGVLELYKNKTELKGVGGMEVEYMISKGMLNACYGMMVTSIEQPVNQYEDGIWTSEEGNLDELICKYNKSKSRFLFYPWGIFVTALVRRIIAESILELGDDYVYADTDSVKFTNFEKHKGFFERFNANIKAKISRSSDFNSLIEDLYQPKTKNGIEKPIGVFDDEGSYKRFKTLGAKRYLVEYPNPHKLGNIETEYSLTISGVNKFEAIPQLLEKAKNEKCDIFDYFHIGFEFDETMAGKNTHTYCDFPIEGYLTDYRGIRGRYKELSFMHLEATTYKLTTTEEYLTMIYLDKENRMTRREAIIP